MLLLRISNHKPDDSIMLLLRFSAFALAVALAPALAQATGVDEYELYKCASDRSNNPNAW
jgi:hypothetical protein